jgi:Flp pilus assembly protein TadD
LVKAAIQLAPANARYRRSLGVVLEAAKQFELAADAYQRAIEKRPKDVQVRLKACFWFIVCWVCSLLQES